MEGKMEDFIKQNFRIKLLAGNNVVSVEAENYESEIFTPEIVNGRIAFLNIIPNRRCCQVIKRNAMNYAKNNSQTTSKEQIVLKPRKKMERMSACQFSEMCVPLANSTPAAVRQRNSSGSMFLSYNSGMCTKDSRLLTPEAVRRVEPDLSPYFIEKSMFKLPKSEIMESGINHNPVKVTPTKFGRILTSASSVTSIQNSANVSMLNSSFRLPCSPSISSKSSSRRSAVSLTPSTPADSIARWQKVLTPVRTYTRNSKNPIMVRRPVLMDTGRKHFKPSRFIPTYLVNPTQGPNVTQQIEMKRRKLIIDNKISISPKTFKKQQKDPLKTRARKSAELHPNSLSFHKPRQYLDTMGMSAFDLITNSNRSRRTSGKLNKQFQKGCVNKASSTYSKYKLLSTVPPLQQDKQILELSRLLLQLSQPAPYRSK